MPQNPPEGYHSVTPQIVAEDARTVLDFVEKVFDADIAISFESNGVIRHSEAVIGGSRLMVASANEEFPPFPAMLNVYVDDVDATFARAVEHGATPLREPEDQFYGDRTAGVLDADGNQWWIATHVEDVSEEEMERRMAAMSG
ncbi:MAG TPA: VOC family protein [Acidimicrobiia bacterium]|jgi:uncharacterized glyoxalase superfamily protein PhnB|nr:VOC family protein [Acidimicrobiia bacterium]